MLFLAALCTFTVYGQNLSADFQDKTLRLDLIFGGNQDKQYILLDELASYPQWYGKRNNLESNLLQGNAEVRVLDKSSRALLYTTSFSTLFQEWISTDQAKEQTMSYENVVLIPFPVNQVHVEINMFAVDGSVSATLGFDVDPRDILIHDKGLQDVNDYVVIHQSKDPQNAIYVAFVAEGYQEQQMDEFIQAARTSVEAIFEHKPFDELKDKFNFVAVKSVSKDSGVSVPREKVWKNTVLSANFDTFYSERYMTTNRLKDMHDALAGTPYNHIIALANTEVYGGGGIFNAYTLTTTGHSNFKPVVVHEFGHSFAGLADEYSYEADALSNLFSKTSEPWEKNITTLVDFDSKWKKILKKNTPVPTNIALSNRFPVGVYEGGNNTGIYRGSLDCRMRTNSYDRFCEVCQNAIVELVEFYTK